MTVSYLLTMFSLTQEVISEQRRTLSELLQQLLKDKKQREEELLAVLVSAKSIYFTSRISEF